MGTAVYSLHFEFPNFELSLTLFNSTWGMNAVCEQTQETFPRNWVELCDKQVLWMHAYLSLNFMLQYFLDTPARTAEKRGKGED